MKALAGRWFFVATALAVCVSAWSALAEEPAAKDLNQAQGTTTVNFAFPIEKWHGDGTRLAWEAVFVAANSDLMGADVAQVDEVLRSHLGLAEGKGLVVTAVANDGPAAQAGIQKNDVLVTVGNEEISGPDALRKSLEASAGNPIAIGLIRGGKKQSVDVNPRSATNGVVWGRVDPAAEPKYWLGLGLASADDTLRSQLALSAGEGLVVTNVENDSPAAKAGVMVNDVLLKLDGKGLTTIEVLSEQLQTVADKSVSLELLRRGKPATLTVTPEKHTDLATVNLNFTNDYLFVAPQLSGVVTSTSWIAEGLNLATDTSKPDLAGQIGELEAQVKQLEASLAALRSAVDAARQPAQSGGEKKEGK